MQYEGVPLVSAFSFGETDSMLYGWTSLDRRLREK